MLQGWREMAYIGVSRGNGIGVKPKRGPGGSISKQAD